MQMLKKERSSNIELFRIITMIIIVAHHYVVNSNLINIIEAKSYLNAQDIFIFLFGWGGKTGINCFVLITGYFMCTSDITVKKYCKLIGEYYFYTIVIWAIFLVTGYSSFSIKEFLNVIFPFFNIGGGFTSCYLLFYLFIPFINKLINSMNEIEHRKLLVLCIAIYTILPSFFKAKVQFNYITWFIILYFIASYIRKYPNKYFENKKLWCYLSIASLVISWLSVIAFAYLERIIGRNGLVYFEVADSNKILALITSVCLFMLFKNLNIKQNKVINNVAASTFGVLLIHANSDTMRKFLWYNVFDGTKYYGTAILYVHAILSVIIIFAICILIDILRRMTLEKVFLEKIDKIKFSK